MLHPAEGQGEQWDSAELARKVAVVLLENATEGRFNTQKLCEFSWITDSVRKPEKLKWLKFAAQLTFGLSQVSHGSSEKN